MYRYFLFKNKPQYFLHRFVECGIGLLLVELHRTTFLLSLATSVIEAKASVVGAQTESINYLFIVSDMILGGWWVTKETSS